jgi:hypothetical protein
VAFLTVILRLVKKGLISMVGAGVGVADGAGVSQ